MPPPLLESVKNVSLWNPYLDPDFTGGGFTPCMTGQGMAKAATRGGADTSLLDQKIYGRLALIDSPWTAARV